MLVGCVGAAFYNVYCKGLMRKFNDRDILIYSYIMATLAAFVVLMWLDPGCFAQLARLSPRAWMAMAFNALLVYGLSMLVFFHVLQFLPVTIALSSVYLLPVFGVLLSMILLGERLTRYAGAGAVVVLVATVLIMKYDAARQ
jgi:drug/metabolite transporter (DMT)-like permease